MVDYGETVEVLPDGLRLALRFGSAANSYLTERVYFVRWGQQRYLVPDWLMIELANNYNRGPAFRGKMFGILRLESEGLSRVREGVPEVPREFAKWFLPGEVELKVVDASVPAGSAVLEGRKVCYTIVFEGGADRGIYEGMRIRYPKGMTEFQGEILITAVTERGCVGEFSTWIGAGARVVPAAIGETISTFDKWGEW